jgi:glycosyltransferase involved in cell wall biosynthesis
VSRVSDQRTVTFVLPGPVARTGGYIYDGRMIDGLRALGWLANSIVVDGSFPLPDTSTRATMERVFGALPDRTLVVVDGLALGAIPEIVESHADRLRIVALVHLPLGADPTRGADTAARLAAAERRALRSAALVIVTSHATVPMLDPHGLPRDRIVVIEPGTDRPQCARGAELYAQRSGGSPRAAVELLCVATVNAGKGHLLLLRALERLRHRSWHLTCAGSLTRDPETTALVRQTISELTLDHRVMRVRWRPPTMRPTCSCWQRRSKPMAWQSPKRWRVDCLWSAPPPAPFQLWSATMRGCWSHPAMWMD